MNFALPFLASAEDYKRIELGGSYERLSPESVYGTWKTGSFSFYHKPIEGFTYSLGLSGFSRKEGEASLVWGGAYKDWTERFYTYSAVSFGTMSDYLPRYRIDQEFNIKVGRRKNLVPALGASYIRYHDIHKDLVISIGFTYYHEGWNFTYRHFINESYPGSVRSSSNLVSVGFGREKSSWTYVDLSFGKQAYLASYLASPEEVRQRSFYIAFKHRRWITKDFGVFADISYLKLNKGYEKYGVGLGAFKEF